MSFFLGLLAKHWKTALSLGLIAGLGLYAGFEHWEYNRARDQKAALIQAEKDATAQAKQAQATADAAEARNKALLAHEATKATAAASRVAATASKRLTSTRQRVKVIYRNTASGKAWSQAPIPASVLAAIKGGGS